MSTGGDWASGDVLWMSRHLDAMRAAHLAESKKMLLALIDAIDSVERMAASADAAALPDDWRQRFTVTQKKLQQALAEFDVRPIPCDGAFDPSMHHSIGTVREGTPGTIVRTETTGYLWKGSLLRAAEVVVSGD